MTKVTTLLKGAALAGAVAMSGQAATAGDFDGFYLGAYASSSIPFGGFGGGAQAGYLYKVNPGGLYVGGEVDVGVPAGFIGMAYARVTHDFGSRFMLGAKAGVGYAGGSTILWGVGGTAQYDLGQGFSIRADGEYLRAFSGGSAAVAKLGINYSS